MTILKKAKIAILLIFMLCVSIETTHAAFHISANASYDANTGVLTVYDAQFTSRSTAKPERMLIGNVRLNGVYEFSAGVMRIYIRNKDEVNQQNGFDTNNASTLYMEYGAVVKIYTPPGGINVDLVSDSNAVSIGLGVVMLRPKVSIDSFVSNQVSTSSKGGNVTLIVAGENLDKVNLSIYDTFNASFIPLSSGMNSASFEHFIKENKAQIKRTDVFTLYINNQPTNWVINISVNPHVVVEDKNDNEKPDDKKTSAKNDNKKKNSEKNNKASFPESSEKDTSDKNKDNKTSSSMPNKKNTKEEEKKAKTARNNKEVSKDNTLFYVGVSTVIVSLIAVSYFRIHKHMKKK